MTSYYNRSEITDFSCLSDEQKQDVLDYMEQEEAENDMFCFIGTGDGERALPLSNFMRIEGSKMWDGYYTTSNTSAYVIKLNKRGDECVVASKYW